MKASWTAALTVLAPISWGTTYVTVTELLPDGRPLLVATMRVLPAGLALVAAGLLASRWRPRGIGWWHTGVLAAFNFGLFFPLLAVAVYRLPGGVAAAVGGLQPLLVLALSRLVNGHRPTATELVAGVAAATGVGLVVMRPSAAFDPVGVLAAVGANASFAAGVVLTRRFPAPPNRLAATGWQLLLSAVVLLPLTAAVEGPPTTVTARDLAGFGYLSLAGTALAFVLWFNGIRRLPVAAPPLLGLAAPVTGALLGWLLLGQSLTPVQLAGFVLTLAAIAYGASLGHPQSAPLTPASQTRLTQAPAHRDQPSRALAQRDQPSRIQPTQAVAQRDQPSRIQPTQAGAQRGQPSLVRAPGRRSSGVRVEAGTPCEQADPVLTAVVRAEQQLACR